MNQNLLREKNFPSIFVRELKNTSSYREKLQILGGFFPLKNLKKTFPVYPKLTLEEQFFVQSIFFIQQEHLLNLENFDLEKCKKLLCYLKKLEQFTQPLGGIIGYHFQMMDLLKKENEETSSKYHLPEFIDLTKKKEEYVQKAIYEGIKSLPFLAEIYPLGGVADRLHLLDSHTNQRLPAAMLPFGGNTLLDVLIQDVQAKEFLYYKLFKKKITIPIAIMTSQEKSNHDHILNFCEKRHWFHRPKDSFRFFTQPLVPAIDENGYWITKEDKQPLLKPGGHGVIWKIAKEEKIFSWLKSLNRKKALIRQINNPIAGLDEGLLAFTGYGMQNNMHFGFASCPRWVGSAEGMNVLVEKKNGKNRYDYFLSNVEYCNFEKFGFKDVPEEKNGNFSKFCSNTNILFVDIDAIQSKVEENPFPGLVMNLKKTNIKDVFGEDKVVKLGRLESTMQNIADSFVETFEKPLIKGERKLKKTYITFNYRHKTISTAKKVFNLATSPLETPEMCFYDLMKNHQELLTVFCNVKMETLPKFEDYLKNGPSCLFSYHPCLGPLYSIIAQKISRGEIYDKSEIKLHISELELKDFKVEGSLQVDSKDLLGSCTLKNVVVQNRGIDWNSTKNPWKGEIKRIESVSIVLNENAEFEAEDISLKGNFYFEVPKNKKMTLKNVNGKIVEILTPIEKNWEWKYEKKSLEIKIERQ